MISVRYGSPHPLRQAVVFFMRQQCGWCSLFPGRVSCSGSELHGIPRKCVTSILLATRFGSRCRAKRRLAVASDVLSWHYSPYQYMFCNESCVLRFQIKFRTGKNAVVLVNCCNSLGMHESVCLFFSTTAIVIFSCLRDCRCCCATTTGVTIAAFTAAYPRGAIFAYVSVSVAVAAVGEGDAS